MAIEKPTCGIVMPISGSGEIHTEEHWLKVKNILNKAIEKAECSPQPVWEGKAHDIIKTTVLQNLFENEIVVCDLSSLNPNVMFEVGIRLTTKKPTVLISEKGTKLPFDTSDFGTIFYDRSLEYEGMDKFIDELSDAIASKLKEAESGEYKTYLENFTFETIEPQSREVSPVDHLTDMVTKTAKTVELLKRQILPDEKAHARESQQPLFPTNLDGPITQTAKYLADRNNGRFYGGGDSTYIFQKGAKVVHGNLGVGKFHTQDDDNYALVEFEGVGLAGVPANELKPYRGDEDIFS